MYFLSHNGCSCSREMNHKKSPSNMKLIYGFISLFSVQLQSLHLSIQFGPPIEIDFVCASVLFGILASWNEVGTYSRDVFVSRPADWNIYWFWINLWTLKMERRNRVGGAWKDTTCAIIIRGWTENCPGLKVPREFPFVLLIRFAWR
jgi:hypothetical protein